MSPADLALAKQELARNDLELIDRKISRTQRFIARGDISTVARQAGLDQLDDLRFERDTVEMAMETHARLASQAEADHAAGMEGGPEPTVEQRQRWADADVQHDAYYGDRGIA